MKARQVLLFLLSVGAALGLLWLVFPADGIAAGGLTLRFASYRGHLRDAAEVKVDVDSVLTAVAERFKMENDTLEHYRRFFHENPDRIYLPDNNDHYFDVVFHQMERASKEGKSVRVLHYGDSQIEMDRISQDLREALQERFGGSGTGLFPALGNVPSGSISRTASGDFVQYTMYGDSTTQRAGHNRYGLLAQVVQLSGGGTVTLRPTTNKNAREGAREFSRISVLYGRTSPDFSLKITADTPKAVVTEETSENGVTRAVWQFSRPVRRAHIVFGGSAELYAIGADGPAGVTVDNIPLRGCSGTIFTRINKPLMQDSMELENVRLIILQFGGNYMPVARSTKVIEQYQEQIEKQLRYFQEVAPEARIIFIGPSDMGKSVNGRVVTWPRLPEVVDSLKATALRNGVAYWDLYRMMGGENSMGQWVKHVPPYAGPDYIHFTPAGARKVGEAFSQSLLTYYDYYLLSR